MKKLIKSPIFALWLTVFIDLLGLGIVIPIFASLFFIPGSDFFLKSVSIGALDINTNLLYGLLVASYPLVQFVGAPILGDLSDKYGRKKMLLLSITGTFISYVIIALGIHYKILLLLFLGRLFDGFTGGNISVAQSSIADLSTKETKSRNFGLIGMAFGLGFVIGPYLGGKLADPSIVSWFDSTTPYVFAGILTFLNIILIKFNLKETLKDWSNSSVDLLGGFRNIGRVFTSKDLLKLFMVSMLFTFGFNFFTQFFQVYGIEKFGFTSGSIGDVFAYLGVWIAITQGAILRPLSKKYLPQQFLKITLLILGLSFFGIFLAQNILQLYIVLPFIAIFNGLSQPNILTLISNSSRENEQGEILGLNQSLQSLMQAIPPIVGGFISSISLNLPILVAGGVTLVAWMVFIVLDSKKIKI